MQHGRVVRCGNRWLTLRVCVRVLGMCAGALNLPTTQDVEKYFMTNPIPLKEKVCIIFHCEFSSHRGPVLYAHLLLLCLHLF